MPQNKSLIFIFLFITYCCDGLAQRYHFEHLDIEDGLAQSQVTTIAQDNKRRLWIGTLGGICRYDGTSFSTYTKTNGLGSNFTLCISTDERDNIWIGTARGISRYDGREFQNYEKVGTWGSSIVATKQVGNFAIIHRKLHKIDPINALRITITKDTSEKITALSTNEDGQPLVAVYGHGIYQLKRNNWTKHPSDIGQKLIISHILKDKFVKNKLWLLTEDGLYASQSGKLSKSNYPVHGKLTAIAQDKGGNIWLATSNGAYRIRANGTLTHFNKSNGFTDNQVNDIFIDVEDNIWFGTDGSGMFKYNKQSYQTVDESQGLRNEIVMSLTTGTRPDEVWLGTYDGLFSYQKGQLKEVDIPSSNYYSKKINVLFKDHNGHTWIGTPGGGLWFHNGKNIEKIDTDNNLAYNAIMEDGQNRIWVATNAGNFLVDRHQKKFVKINELFTSSLLELSKDSVIIGTQEGAYLIEQLKNVKLINIKKVAESSVLSMVKYQNLVFFGTSENGLIIWNRITGKILNMTTKNGLDADQIYSLLVDKDGIVWIGSGKGVNRVDAKNLQILNSGQLNRMVECNQNAILQKDDKVWIGTIKGALIYQQKPEKRHSNKPYLFLTGVHIFSKDEMHWNERISEIFYPAQRPGKTAVLPFAKNSLNINFAAVYLTNPEAVFYQYRLLGLESKFSQPSSNTSVNYMALPAGKYTFEVKAGTGFNRESINSASFSFEIKPPYYQTNLFRIVFILFLICIVLLTVYAIIQLNERKRKLRLRIKLEEQFKIRKQTAEDFHDDLGNKLTRISVLSDVLLSMIEEGDSPKRNMIHKINSNVQELYTGTKDILWALNPKNDSLSDLLGHIRDFGKGLFDDTDVEFIYQINNDIKNVKLSLQISRNILMIFKEAMHNSLKHSKAKYVKLSVKANDELLEIKVEDDGSGLAAKNKHEGHGINNMTVRAKRIDAYLIIDSSSNGTTVNLCVKLSALNNLKNV